MYHSVLKCEHCFGIHIHAQNDPYIQSGRLLNVLRFFLIVYVSFAIPQPCVCAAVMSAAASTAAGCVVVVTFPHENMVLGATVAPEKEK